PAAIESALPAAAANGIRKRSADAIAGSPNWSGQSCVSARHVESVSAPPKRTCASVITAREVSRKPSALFRDCVNALAYRQLEGALDTQLDREHNTVE